MADRNPKFYYYGVKEAVVSVKELRSVFTASRKEGVNIAFNYRKTKAFVKNLTRVEA